MFSDYQKQSKDFVKDAFSTGASIVENFRPGEERLRGLFFQLDTIILAIEREADHSSYDEALKRRLVERLHRMRMIACGGEADILKKWGYPGEPDDVGGEGNEQ